MVRLAIFLDFLKLILAVPRHHENRLHLGVAPGLYVVGMIAHKEGGLKVDIVFFGGPLHQPGVRLAAGADLPVGVGAVLGVVGAVVDGVHESPAVQKLLLQGLIDGLEHIFPHIAPGYARLVADDDHLIARLIEHFYGLGGVGQEL